MWPGGVKCPTPQFSWLVYSLSCSSSADSPLRSMNFAAWRTGLPRETKRPREQCFWLRWTSVRSSLKVSERGLPLPSFFGGLLAAPATHQAENLNGSPNRAPRMAVPCRCYYLRQVDEFGFHPNMVGENYSCKILIQTLMVGPCEVRLRGASARTPD